MNFCPPYSSALLESAPELVFVFVLLDKSSLFAVAEEEPICLQKMHMRADSRQMSRSPAATLPITMTRNVALLNRLFLPPDWSGFGVRDDVALLSEGVLEIHGELGGGDWNAQATDASYPHRPSFPAKELLSNLCTNAGTPPVRLLSEQLKNVRFFRSARDGGKLPLKLFTERSSACKLVRFPIAAGIVEERPLLLTFKAFRKVRLLMRSADMEPVRALKERSKNVRLETGSCGSEPFSSLWERSSMEREGKRFVSAEGTDPCRELWLMRSSSSDGRKANEEAEREEEKLL